MNKPECKISASGDRHWMLNADEDGDLIYHREDGPAIEHVDGSKEWYLNGKLHREDGPAIEYASGNKYWWLSNEEVDPETIVDLWLMRGKFCFYDKDNDCLNFG
jgi:hypothetical protein